MTIKYNNVFIEDAYTICGNYENDGPLSKYFDKKYEKDLYFGEKSWEQAEVHLLKEANTNILKKNKLKEEDIDLLISGDLQNQIAASNYMAREFNIPFLGRYDTHSQRAAKTERVADRHNPVANLYLTGIAKLHSFQRFFG